MSTLQQYQFWVGLGFTLLLVIFFIVAFFTAKNMTGDQRNILRFLAALCGGFAGALITGDALFKLDGTMGAEAKYAITGAAGFALFFTIWFFFPKAAGYPDAFNFSVPEGWTFRQTADTLAQRDNAFVEYEGFEAEQLNAPLRPWEFHGKSVDEAIRRLRSITATPDAVPKYSVKLKDSTYHLSTRN